MSTNARPEQRKPSDWTYGFEIDPCVVLGISSSATLQEIRDAYRLKVKKHHPDHGGDEWAFTIVTRCYELVSTTRVVGHAIQESHGSVPRQHPADSERTRPRDIDQPEEQWLRPGERDRGVNPMEMIDVEIFVVRYELNDPMEVFSLPPEERCLCSCLNVSWKRPGEVSGDPLDSSASRVLHSLTRLFGVLPSRTQAISSWSSVGEDQFTGWMSYPTVVKAWDAFTILRSALKEHGLGVNQYTREMVLPRGGTTRT